jgi:hypothetical protein
MSDVNPNVANSNVSANPETKNPVQPTQTPAIDVSAGQSGDNGANSENDKDKKERREKKKDYRSAAQQLDFAKSFEPLVLYEEFCWPEKRETSESILRELKIQNVLFVRGFKSVWWEKAPERLACVLQSSLLLLWPECSGVFQSRKVDEGDAFFGFWEKYEKQERPVVVFISYKMGSEYLKTIQKYEPRRIYSNVIMPLKNKNICLLIQVNDSDDFRMLNKSSEARLNAVVPEWKVDSFGLELLENKVPNADFILQALREEVGLTYENQEVIFGLIAGLGMIDKDELVNKIQQMARAGNRENILLDTFIENNDELALRLLFAGSFLNGCSLGDFEVVVEILLSNYVVFYSNDKGERRRKLADTWNVLLERIAVMQKCKLTTVHNGNSIVVRFHEDISAKRLQTCFLQPKYYNFFFFFARLIMESSLLFNPSISFALRSSIINIFLLAIKYNADTFNGKWLLYKTVQKLFNKNISLNESIELAAGETEVNYEKRKLQPLVILLKELLMSDTRVLVQVAKNYFESFIKVNLDENVALELIIDLYNELLGNKNFPEEELDEYLKKSIETGGLENARSVYLILRKNFDLKKLYSKVSIWLNDGLIPQRSNVKIIACICILDYCIIQMYASLSKTLDTSILALVTKDDRALLNEEFTKLAESIVSEDFVTNLEAAFEKDLEVRLQFLVIESVITDLELPFYEEALVNLSIADLPAEIIFNWFYILVKENDFQTDHLSEKMTIFVRFIKELSSTDLLTKCIKFWKVKEIDFYNRYILLYKNWHELKRLGINYAEKDEIINTLIKRRATLELLKKSLQ